MATLHNQDEYIKTALRLPRDLHARVQKEAEAEKRSMNAQIIEALQSYFKDLDREEYENSPEYLEQLHKEQGAASAPYVVPMPRKPTDPAIEVLKMTREQKTAFVASIDRTLNIEKGNKGQAQTHAMLIALRDAATQEIGVIDAQIEGKLK